MIGSIQRNLINQSITRCQNNIRQLNLSPKDIEILNRWMKSHPKEVKASPVLSMLSRQINLPQSFAIKSSELNMYEQAIHSINSVKKIDQTPNISKDIKIEQLILNKDVEQINNYFCQYPEDLVEYADLIKTHVDLENLKIQDLLILLEEGINATPIQLKTTPSPLIGAFLPTLLEHLPPDKLLMFLNSKSKNDRTPFDLLTKEVFNTLDEQTQIRFVSLLVKEIPDSKFLNDLSTELNVLKEIVTRQETLSLDLIKTFSEEGKRLILTEYIKINKIPLQDLRPILSDEDFLGLAPDLQYIDLRDFDVDLGRKILQNCFSPYKLKINDSKMLESLSSLPFCTELNCSQCFDLEMLPQLPACVKLNCSQCLNLKMLPQLPVCTKLECSDCSNLKTLPELLSCTFLDCSFCSNLEVLPQLLACKELVCLGLNKLNELPELRSCIHLNCSGCINLTTLPNLPVCDKLTCSKCSSLTVIPELRACTYLDCSNCSNLQALKELRACTYLDCSNCPNLQQALPELRVCTYLDCSNCPNLEELPELPACITLACHKCSSLRVIPELPACSSLNCSECIHLIALLGLPVCTTVNCSGCPDLITLPESLPVCINLNYRNSPIERIPLLPFDARINGNLEFTRLNVDIGDFQKNPIKLLQAIGTCLVNNKPFPQIYYFENNVLNEVIDAGGVQRDFLTRLMESVFKDAEWKDQAGAFLKYDQGLPSTSSYLVNKEAKLSILNKEIELFTAEGSRALSLKEEIENSFFKDGTQTREAKEVEAFSLNREIEALKANESKGFKAFGALLALCYSDSSEFKTGPLPFSESLFEALAVGDPKSPGEIPSDEWFLNAIAITAELSEEAKKSLINLEKPLVGTESDLFKLIYLLELDEEINWSWSMLQNDTSIRSKIIEQAKKDPTVAILKLIAQTMKSRLEPQSWNDLQRLKSEELKEKIEGQLNADMLKQHIDWEASPGTDKSKLDKVKAYFEAWVDANKENKAKLELFVRAVTGNKTLTRRMKADVFNREVNRLPETHTCAFSIEFTQDYQDQEAFNNALSMLLEVTAKGTGFTSI